MNTFRCPICTVHWCYLGRYLMLALGANTWQVWQHIIMNRETEASGRRWPWVIRPNVLAAGSAEAVMLVAEKRSMREWHCLYRRSVTWSNWFHWGWLLVIISRYKVKNNVKAKQMCQQVNIYWDTATSLPSAQPVYPTMNYECQYMFGSAPSTGSPTELQRCHLAYSNHYADISRILITMLPSSVLR